MTTPSPDLLTRFLLPDAGIRGVHVHLDDAWAQIRASDDYPETVAGLLGDAVTAAALFTANTKVEGRLSVQLSSNGPLRTLFAECTAAHTLRGIARGEDALAEVPTDLRHLGEDTLMAITVENPGIGTGEPHRYQGLVPIESASVSAAFEDYFVRSEQLPTRLLLVTSDSQTAGLLLQKLPGDEGDADGWNRGNALFDTLTAPELLDCPVEILLHRLFHQEAAEILTRHPLRFACSCSRERVAEVLLTLGEEEAYSALADTPEIEVRCEFCGQRYAFDRHAIDTLFAKAETTVEGTARLQ